MLAIGFFDNEVGMELRQLATFRAVATTLSFTRSASALGYAQSSVTAQIQALEEELSVRLFDRLGSRVVLTEAGRRMLPFAERILDMADAARLALSESEEPAGPLAICAPETLWTYRLPSLLRKLQSDYPGISLALRPSHGSMLDNDLRRMIIDGMVDVAFVLEEPFRTTGLEVEPLLIEPLQILAAPTHPLAGTTRVSPADLEGERLLLTEVGCGYRAMFERTLLAAGVRPMGVLEFSSVEAIKQCLMAGLGVAVLPAIAAEAEVAQGRLAVLRWTERDFQVSTQMIWHKDKWLSPTLRTFLDCARSVITPRALA
jgi:DNA-binding transcriptional LysR family regulator